MAGAAICGTPLDGRRVREGRLPSYVALLLGKMASTHGVRRRPHGLLVARPAVVRPPTVTSPATIATAIRPSTMPGSLIARVVAEAVVAEDTVTTTSASITTMSATSTTRMEVTASAPSLEPWIESRVEPRVEAHAPTSTVLAKTSSVARPLRSHCLALTNNVRE
jgi:hypothetical protein